MIEILEKPCFYKMNRSMDGWGLYTCEDGCQCPYMDTAVRYKWEICKEGKKFWAYKNYIRIFTERLRNYFAKGAMESLIKKLHIETIFEDGNFGDIKIKESNMSGISKACFQVADLMIEAKFKDAKERQERSKTRKLDVED